MDNAISAQANGRAQATDDEAVTAPLRARIDELHARRDAVQLQRDDLQGQLDAITAEARRYEKAISVIAGEPLRKRTAVVEDDRPRPGRAKPAGVSDERLARVERAIRQLAAESDDVTQVAVRAITGDNSGPTAIAFEVLRQREVIRLVRRDGNVKVYRLTRKALAAESAGA